MKATRMTAWPFRRVARSCQVCSPKSGRCPTTHRHGAGPAGNVATFIENIDGIGLFAAPPVVGACLVGVIQTEDGRPTPGKILERREEFLRLTAFFLANALRSRAERVHNDDVVVFHRELVPRSLVGEGRCGLRVRTSVR